MAEFSTFVAEVELWVVYVYVVSFDGCVFCEWSHSLFLTCVELYEDWADYLFLILLLTLK